MNRAQELVDAHFDNYVGPLLTAAGVEEKVIALCAFMYKSSGIHFYKHAQEDAAEAARGALANDAAHRETPTDLLSFALRALCLTRDYVEGAVELPAKEGWDWYDAGAKIAAAISDDKWAREFRLRTETTNDATP